MENRKEFIEKYPTPENRLNYFKSIFNPVMIDGVFEIGISFKNDEDFYIVTRTDYKIIENFAYAFEDTLL